MTDTPANAPDTAADQSREVMVDAYTHYAPKALAQYLEECSGRPLVFAKVRTSVCGLLSAGWVEKKESRCPQ